MSAVSFSGSVADYRVATGELALAPRADATILSQSSRRAQEVATSRGERDRVCN